VTEPTFEQELARKAYAEVERAFSDYKASRCSKRELEQQINTIWNVCSGFSPDILEVLTAASEQIAALPPDDPVATLLAGPHKLLLVRWAAGDNVCVTNTLDTSLRPRRAQFGKPECEKPYVAARMARQTIVNRALMQGFKPLEA
jgi:hypothetical protein